MSFINLPARIIGLLESNVSSREIAAGVCLGLFLGFTPLNGPMALLLVLFFFIFRINRVSTLLTLPIFKAAYLLGLSGALERFGGYLLIDAKPLSGFWAFVTGLPIVAYLDLNNTLVAGGLVASAALSVPLYFIARQISITAKDAYAAKVKNSKVAKAVSGLKAASKIDSAVNTDSGISLDIKGIWRMMFGSVRARIIGGRAPSTGWRKRVNLTGIAVTVIVLLVIQFGVGMAVSPLASSFIIDAMNRTAGTKILADRVNVWPLTLSFSAKGLKVFDPEKPDARIVKADDAVFRMSPAAFLSRRLVFSSIRLNGAEIDLEGKPDGSFNVQGLGKPVKSAGTAAGPVKLDIGSIWNAASEKKDAAGKTWKIIKDRFSKKGQEKRRLERTAKSSAKTVTDLPKGRSVHFKAGRGSYLFEIRKLALDNGYIKIKPYNAKAIEIDKAAVSLEKLAFDPDNGVAIGSFSIRGVCISDGKDSGSLDIFFSQSDNGARVNIDLDNIDLNAVRFIYQDLLPVNVVKGVITLSSKNSIKGDVMDSRTSLSLTGHRLEAKNGLKLAFGIMPVSMIVEALNGIDPVKLTFSVGGTVDDPKAGGFQESLMALVKPYISNVKDRVVKEGARKAMDSLRTLFNKKGE